MDPNDQQQEVIQDQDSGTGNKAPYAEYLEGLPESVIPLVEPAFKKWDADTSTRFQKVHSEYDDVKPFRDLVQQGVDYDTAVRGLTLLQRLEADPRAVYDAMAASFGFAEQGQTPPGDEDEFSSEEITDPRFAQVEGVTKAMAEYLLAQEQEKVAQAAEQQLDQTLTALHSAHGDFDEEFVLTRMYNGSSPENAVKAYNELVENAVKARQRPVSPILMGAGGGIPTEPVNVSQASNKDIKALVAATLRNANQEP